MKRITLITLALVLSAGMAFAYGGMGRGMGGGYCMNQQGFGPGQGMGQGKGMGFNPNCPRGMQQPNFTPVTKDDAKKKAEEFMAANLKGYKIDKAEEFQTPRFKVYSFTVKDSAGNSFLLRVNPRGYVVGPFVAQQ